MELTYRDMKILLSMSLLLIIINFVFPTLGFVSEDVEIADIPEFNITEGTFSFVQTVPEFPSRPSEGTLKYVDNQVVSQDNRRIWLNGDTSGGTELVLLNGNNLSNPNARIILNEYNSSGFVGSNETHLNNSDDFETLERNDYILAFENAQFDNIGLANLTITADWEIIQQPSDTTWLGRIPIVGGVVSGAQQLAAVVGWIGTILWHLVYNFIVASTNLLTVIYNVITFFISLLHWFIVTYAVIIDNSPENWISLFLAIPGILLSLVFSKFVIIIIRSMPTT